MAFEKNRADVLAKVANSAVDLQQEWDELLKLLRFQRESLWNNMTKGFGYKQEQLDSGDARLAVQLTGCYDKAVAAKIKLDKHLKDMADGMSKEEEVASIKKYIENLDSTTRRGMLIELLQFHNANCTNTTWLIKSE